MEGGWGGGVKPWWQNGLTEGDLRDWDDSGRSAAALAAIQWRRVVQTTDDEKKALGADRFIEVRYEDFVQSPVEVVGEIFKQCGLETSPRATRYITTRGEIKNMNHRFRYRLTLEQISTVERLTKSAVALKGYSYNDN